MYWYMFSMVHWTPNQRKVLLLKRFMAYCLNWLWSIWKLFPNLRNLWNFGNVSYGVRPWLIFLGRKHLSQNLQLYWVVPEGNQLCNVWSTCMFHVMNFVSNYIYVISCSLTTWIWPFFNKYLTKELHIHKVIPLQALPAFMKSWTNICLFVCCGFLMCLFLH